MRPFLKLPITLPFKLSALVEQLEVVLARVEPLLPTLALPVDWEHTFAAIWKTQNLSGYLVGVDKTPTTRLSDILGVDRQKASLVANTEQFLEGLPANNALLTGSRGTGKSSLIQALLNEYAQAGLRVVQVDKSDLAHLMEIVAALEGQPYRFILFCDDLSFESQDEGYKALKSALDGGVDAARAQTHPHLDAGLVFGAHGAGSTSTAQPLPSSRSRICRRPCASCSQPRVPSASGRRVPSR